MNKETTFLIENLTKNLVLLVMEEFGYSITEAMDVVYNSQLYEKILDLKTGLYYQSAGYNFDLLHNEILTGRVAQYPIVKELYRRQEEWTDATFTALLRDDMRNNPLEGF